MSDGLRALGLPAYAIGPIHGHAANDPNGLSSLGVVRRWIVMTEYANLTTDELLAAALAVCEGTATEPRADRSGPRTYVRPSWAPTVPTMTGRGVFGGRS